MKAMRIFLIVFIIHFSSCDLVTDWVAGNNDDGGNTENGDDQSDEHEEDNDVEEYYRHSVDFSSN